MVVKIGSIAFEVSLMNPSKPVEELSLADLQDARITIFAPNLLLTESKPKKVKPVVEKTAKAAPAPIQEAAIEDDDDEEDDEEEDPNSRTVRMPGTKPTPLNDLALLAGINISSHTITMVSKKLLRIKTSSKRLQEDFKVIKDATKSWLDEDIEQEGVWAIYVGSIHPPKVGKRMVAVGINAENQMVILGFVEGKEKDLYENLKRRGLDMSGVKFGLLPFQFAPPHKLFCQYFPNAKIGRDWNEFMDSHESEDEQQEIKEIMVGTNRKEVESAMKDFKAPKELFTYFNFDPGMWRVLRSANNINKIDLELRSNTHMPLIKTKEQIDFVITWSLLRIQYQWLRIPVDGKQYTTLRNLKPMALLSK